MVYILGVALLALWMAVSCFANAAAFRPPKADKSGIGGRKVTFRNGRNRLTGYVWNESGTRGWIVLAHGMGTSVGYHLPEIEHFAERGYRVFAFEYSGYGESDGRFRGFPQALSDLKSAVELIDDGRSPVILIGHSMGGYAVCTAVQYLNRPVDAVVAYAPFYSSGEAITEMTRGAGFAGRVLRLLILPVQHLLFGARHRDNGVDALRRANIPALILQGTEDEEVTCHGCSLYAHREELVGGRVVFRTVEEAGSNGHMTVIRKKGTRTVNEDTMRETDAFLDEIGGGLS